MKEPAYKPDQWITFEHESASGFGQIVGGSYNDGWVYTVKGSTVDAEPVVVAEAAIIHLLQNGSWLVPNRFGGQGSVYADVESELES